MPTTSIRITGHVAIDYAEHIGEIVGFDVENGTARFVDVETARKLAKGPTLDFLFFDLPCTTLEALNLRAANEGNRPLMFTATTALQGDTIAAGICARVLIETTEKAGS